MSVENAVFVGHEEWVRSLEIAYGVPVGYFDEGYQYLLSFVGVTGARCAMLDLVHRMHKKRSTISPLSLLELAHYALDLLVSRGFYAMGQDRSYPVRIDDFVRLVEFALRAGERAAGKNLEELDTLPQFMVRCTQCGTEVEISELYEFAGERLDIASCAECPKAKGGANGE